MARPIKTAKCLIPDCGKSAGGSDAGGRGLCKPHYIKAHRQVQLGYTSWDELQELGLAAPTATKLVGIRNVIESRRKERGKFVPGLMMEM